MDYTPPGSPVLGDSPGKNTEVGSHSLLQRIFPTRDRTYVYCLAGRFLTTEPPVKPCPTSLLQEMQIKRTMRCLCRLLCPPLSLRVCSNSCPLSPCCYLTVSSSHPLSPPALWILSKTLQRTNVGENMEKRGPWGTVDGIVNWCSHYGKQYGDPSKTENRTSMSSSNSTSRYLSEVKKTLTWKTMCILMFIATLFTIAKAWK